ncbi:MAG: isoprenylcysteine carboxylmethyltransferase family protein, partial [Actinobacteria bacterium]|nr:isoprenylcysteine carboxylmethyltransferase family protein [Actinomycetota bacterium]
RELSEQERADYLRRWLNVQRTFTEHPNTALRDADELVTAVFVDIGYPSERFEDRAADLSVEHADVARDYREARAVVEDVQRGTAGTEEMRRAMLQYRGVFQRVADVDVSEEPERESQTWTTRPGLLPDEDRATLANRMQQVEETFIDDASASVRQADELVTDGPYARSRHPMYVGWTLIYGGISLVTGNVWLVFLFPPLLGLAHLETTREEKELRSAFGAEYDEYRSRVRRYF